jgi:hypothetical protein
MNCNCMSETLTVVMTYHFRGGEHEENNVDLYESGRAVVVSRQKPAYTKLLKM